MVRFLNRIIRLLESFFTMTKEDTYTRGIVTSATLTSSAVHRYLGEFPKVSDLSFSSVDYTLHHSNNNSLLTTDLLFFTATNSLFCEIDLYKPLVLVFFLQAAFRLWISTFCKVESLMESEVDEVQISPMKFDVTSPLLYEPEVFLIESNIASPLYATEEKPSTKSNSTDSNSGPVTQPYDQQCQRIFATSSALSINPNPQFQMLLRAMVVSKLRSNAFNIKSKEKEE